MDAPPALDDPLIQPTRARLFALLGATRGPVGTDELASRLELHPNGVRVHLERLRAAGLVVRERPRQSKGRPRDLWTIAADAAPSGEPPRAYADLGLWLTRVIASGKTGQRGIEKAGRRIGRDLAPEQSALPPEPTMHAALSSMGFRPRREPDGEGGLTYKLGNCPYRDAASESQNVVCTLHRGITRGLLDRLAPETQLADFVPKDPYAGGCLIHLRGGLADDDPAGRATGSRDPTPGPAEPTSVRSRRR